MAGRLHFPTSIMANADTLLVESARHGDAAAFRALVIRHQRKAYAVALGVVRDPDDARDVCQEAFIKVYRGLAGFDGNSQFFTWLYRIVVNLSIDHLRRRRTERVELDETRALESSDDAGEIVPQQLTSDPARALAQRELREQIGSALDRLSHAHRTVLVLRELNGLSYKEIAVEMRCSVGTVMSRLFHARKKMQAFLLENADQNDDALALAA